MVSNEIQEPADDRNLDEDGALDETSNEEREFDTEDADDEPVAFEEDTGPDLDDLDDEVDLDDSELGVDTDIERVALSNKEQNARSLEIRRALEEQRERRRLSEDLDYLDLDLDD